MAFEKPSQIVLQGTHGFVSSLVGAWLFAQGTGDTFADSSLGNHPLTRGAGTGTLWTNAGVNAWYLRLDGTQRLSAPVHADFLHGNTDPWTIIFWVTRRGAQAGTYQRLMWRSNNVIDTAFKINTWQPAWFSGAAWQDITGGSSVSGTDEMWAWSFDGTNVRTFKGSQAIASGVTTLDSRAFTPTIAQNLNLYNTSPVGTEGLVADSHMVFYHRRALTQAELATHYSAPFEAFQTPPPPPPVNREPYIGGEIIRSFYDHGNSYQGGSDHLLDWLAGG